MNLAEHHAALCLPPQARILGVPLVPFSVGHARLLTALGFERAETLGDLISALLICSRPAPMPPSYQPNGMRLLMANLQPRFGLLDRLRVLWIGFCLRFLSGRLAAGPMILFLRARQQWDEYLEYYHRAPALAPAVAPRDGDLTIHLATPRLAHVEHHLCASGLSPEVAWRLPLNEALWRYAVAKEVTGQYQILETEDISADDYDALQRQADANHDRLLSTLNSQLSTAPQ